MNTNVEQVLTHHLTAFGNNDLDAILKDYTEDSVILTPIGKVAGLKKIRNFFNEFFSAISAGLSFSIKQKIIEENVAYILWESESELFKIPVGTDTFFFDNNKIMYHTVADDRMGK